MEANTEIQNTPTYNCGFKKGRKFPEKIARKYTARGYPCSATPLTSFTSLSSSDCWHSLLDRQKQKNKAIHFESFQWFETMLDNVIEVRNKCDREYQVRTEGSRAAVPNLFSARVLQSWKKQIRIPPREFWKGFLKHFQSVNLKLMKICRTPRDYSRTPGWEPLF